MQTPLRPRIRGSAAPRRRRRSPSSTLGSAPRQEAPHPSRGTRSAAAPRRGDPPQSSGAWKPTAIRQQPAGTRPSSRIAGRSARTEASRASVPRTIKQRQLAQQAPPQATSARDPTAPQQSIEGATAEPPRQCFSRAGAAPEGSVRFSRALANGRRHCSPSCRWPTPPALATAAVRSEAPPRAPPHPPQKVLAGVKAEEGRAKQAAGEAFRGRTPAPTSTATSSPPSPSTIARRAEAAAAAAAAATAQEAHTQVEVWVAVSSGEEEEEAGAAEAERVVAEVVGLEAAEVDTAATAAGGVAGMAVEAAVEAAGMAVEAAVAAAAAAVAGDPPLRPLHQPTSRAPPFQRWRPSRRTAAPSPRRTPSSPTTMAGAPPSSRSAPPSTAIVLQTIRGAPRSSRPP